jgi:hypothetical protein
MIRCHGVAYTKQQFAMYKLAVRTHGRLNDPIDFCFRPVCGLHICAPESDLHSTVDTASAPISGVPLVSTKSPTRPSSGKDHLGPASSISATKIRHSTSPHLSWLMARLGLVALGNRVPIRLQANPLGDKSRPMNAVSCTTMGLLHGSNAALNKRIHDSSRKQHYACVNSSWTGLRATHIQSLMLY